MRFRVSSLLVLLSCLVASIGCNRPEENESEVERNCTSYCEGLTCLDTVPSEFPDTCIPGCLGWYENATEDGPACEAAFLDGLRCVATLECKDLEKFAQPESADAEYPCKAEELAIEEPCGAVGLR